MIKIKFNDEPYMHDVEFRRLNDNIVYIIGLQEINTTGFKTFDSDGEYLGDFSDYATMYRALSDGIQYSNNGSVWIEPITELKAIVNGADIPSEINIKTSTGADITLFSPLFTETVSGDNVIIIESEDLYDFYHTINGSIVTYTKKSDEEKREEEESKLRSEKSIILADMLIITREPSDKLGFDFEIYTLGNIELRREYVPSGNHSGTIEDPIPFELGLRLIPNAYYIYDDHLWVYMGQGNVTADEYPMNDINGWVLWE